MGNGLTSTFPFTFPIFAAAHLVVTHIASDGAETPQVQSTNYTLTWTGPGKTGSISRIRIVLGVPEPYPLPTGESYRLARTVPLTQDVDLVNNSRVRIDQMEKGLDYNTQISQQLARAEHADKHIAGASGSLPWGTIHGRGLLSERPAASKYNLGYIYYSTDIYLLSRSNGASWDDMNVDISELGSRVDYIETYLGLTGVGVFDIVSPG